jgi:hypothetical protein
MGLASNIFGGVSLQVVAGSSSPAFAFTQANSGAGSGGAVHQLCANGISLAPSFPAGWTQQGSGSYSNSAGVINSVGTWSDGWEFFYNFLPDSAATTPAPTSFIGGNGTQQLTVTYSGVTLAAVTPPLSAFTLTAARPGAGGSQILNPYTLAFISSVTAGASQIVLNLADSATFVDGDVVTLSYVPPSANPLQDDATGTFKCLAFTAATVTVQ